LNNTTEILLEIQTKQNCGAVLAFSRKAIVISFFFGRFDSNLLLILYKDRIAKAHSKAKIAEKLMAGAVAVWVSSEVVLPLDFVPVVLFFAEVVDGEPVAEPVAEPVVDPVAGLVADPVTEPVLEPVAEPVTEPVFEPVA